MTISSNYRIQVDVTTRKYRVQKKGLFLWLTMGPVDPLVGGKTDRIFDTYGEAIEYIRTQMRKDFTPGSHWVTVDK